MLSIRNRREELRCVVRGPSLIATLFGPPFHPSPVLLEGRTRLNSISETVGQFGGSNEIERIVGVHATDQVRPRGKVMDAGLASDARLQRALNRIPAEVVRAVVEAGVKQRACLSESDTS
jgi:hypothetical protein